MDEWSLRYTAVDTHVTCIVLLDCDWWHWSLGELLSSVFNLLMNIYNFI